MSAKPSKRLVVSAVNFSEGGPLTVLIDSLDAAVTTLGDDWEILALVHDTRLITNPRIRTRAIPETKRSWLKRLQWEWHGFQALSRQLKPDLWVSLHDITPRVQARRQAVYCHNPSPFYRVTWREALLEPKFVLFNLFYAQLYRVFIGRNDAVVVQQDWLRQAFGRLYHHPHIIVAHPGTQPMAASAPPPVARPHAPGSDQPLVLLYPALARVFKNMEVVCEAVAALPEAVARRLEVRLTLTGTENRYARHLLSRYGATPGVRFIGRQNRQQMADQYARCDAVLFPSKLETWGLPITEAKALGKPLLVADLPYAHETVGTYEQVAFLPPDNPQAWAATFHGLVDGRPQTGSRTATPPDAPFAPDWPTLWQLLTKGL